MKERKKRRIEKKIERKRNESEEENIFRFFVVRQVYSIL